MPVCWIDVWLQPADWALDVEGADLGLRHSCYFKNALSSKTAGKIASISTAGYRHLVDVWLLKTFLISKLSCAHAVLLGVQKWIGSLRKRLPAAHVPDIVWALNSTAAYENFISEQNKYQFPVQTGILHSPGLKFSDGNNTMDPASWSPCVQTVNFMSPIARPKKRQPTWQLHDLGPCGKARNWRVFRSFFPLNPVQVCTSMYYIYYSNHSSRLICDQPNFTNSIKASILFHVCKCDFKGAQKFVLLCAHFQRPTMKELHQGAPLFSWTALRTSWTGMPDWHCSFF